MRSPELPPLHPASSAQTSSTPTNRLTVSVCHPSPERGGGDIGAPRCSYAQAEDPSVWFRIFISKLQEGLLEVGGELPVSEIPECTLKRFLEVPALLIGDTRNDW